MPRITRTLSSLLAAAILLAVMSASAGAAPLRWSAGRQIDRSAGVGLDTLVCPTASECVALDADSRLVRFDPASPAQATRVQITAPSRLADLSCASATQCTLVDATGGETTFDPTGPPRTLTFTTLDPAFGATTSATAVQSGAVTCPSSGECLLADGAGNLVVFDPVTGSVSTTVTLATGQDFGLQAVACVSTSQCTAISRTREWTFDPGSPGTPAPSRIDSAAGSARALTCVSATQCTAVDGSGHETTFDPQTGATAGPVSLATSIYSQFNSVSCPSATLCVAADLSGHLTSFDPMSGQSLADVAAVDVHSVACPTTSGCVAVDGAGRALTFAPGSAAAPASARIDAGAPLVAVACPGRTQCTAIDARHELTFDPRSTRVAMHLRTLPGRATSSVGALACPSLALCSAIRVDSQITFDPRAFGHPGLRLADHNSDAAIVAVRCPSQTECVTVDGDGTGVTYDPRSGRITRRDINVEQVEALTALACPSRAQCTATDNNGTAITFDPQTGRRLRAVKIDAPVGLDAPSGDSNDELDAIACRGTALCVAVDTLGNVISFDPRDPRGGRLHAIDPGRALTTVACPSRTLCVLGDSGGRVWSAAPGAARWTETWLSGASSLTSVACVTGRECVAVDTAGDAFTSR